jgi:hypothetical protein
LGDSVDAYTAVTLLQSTVGISNFSKNDFTVTVLPNPSNGIFNFEIYSLKNEQFTLEIQNELGEKIISTEFNASIGKSTVPGMLIPKPGIYFYRLISHDKIRNGKIILN